MTPRQPGAPSAAQMEALVRCAAAGGAHASEAMSVMTGRSMSLSGPVVRAIEVARVADLMGGAESPVVAVHMRIHGPSRGDMLMALSPESAGWMLAAVLRRPLAPFDPDGLTPLEESALLEIGNMVAGSYLNAVSDTAHLSLFPSIPAIAIDMAGAVVDDLLAGTARGASSMLLIEMSLATGPIGGRAQLLHLPEPETLHRLIAALSPGGEEAGRQTTGGV